MCCRIMCSTLMTSHLTSDVIVRSDLIKHFYFCQNLLAAVMLFFSYLSHKMSSPIVTNFLLVTKFCLVLKKSCLFLPRNLGPFLEASLRVIDHKHYS